MKHRFDGIVMMLLTVTIAIIMVSSIVLPQVFTPTVRSAFVVNNATDLAPVNSTGYQNATFTTTYVYALAGCNLTVGFNHNYTPNYTVLADISNTVIANFTAATNNASNVTTIAIPAANVNSTTDSAGSVVQQWRYNTSSAVTGVNVTDANLTCIRKSVQEQQAWDAGTTALWAIIGLVVVAMLILMVFGGRR